MKLLSIFIILLGLSMTAQAQVNFGKLQNMTRQKLVNQYQDGRLSRGLFVYAVNRDLLEELMLYGKINEHLKSIENRDSDRYYNQKSTSIVTIEKLQDGIWWKSGDGSKSIYKLVYNINSNYGSGDNYYRCDVQLSQKVLQNERRKFVIGNPSCEYVVVPRDYGRYGR